MCSLFLIVRFMYVEGGWKRLFLPEVGLLGLFLTCGPVLDEASRHDWWGAWRMALVVLALVVLLFVWTALVLVAQRVGVPSALATLLNSVAVYSPRVLGVTLLGWSAVRWYPAVLDDFGGEPRLAGVLALLLIFVTPVFSLVPNRASLHREYRARLASCFSVHRRDNAAVPTGRVFLTELAPPSNAATRFPRLLVCATANVHVPAPGGGSQTFVSFVLSHDVCGVPGMAGASYDTSKLELVQVPGGMLTSHREPLLSLFTAVATTGAAISPSMGRSTLPSLRMIIAAANIRLGRWFPKSLRSTSPKCGVEPHKAHCSEAESESWSGI